VNYGGRAEIVDAHARIAARSPRAVNPAKIDERTIAANLRRSPACPDVEPVSSNVGGAAHVELPAVAIGVPELVFIDTPWPDFDRRHLWQACLA